MNINFKKFFSILIFAVVSTIGLSAADLNVTGMDNNVDAALLLKTWASDIGFTPSMSESREMVFIDDGYKFGLAIKVSLSGIDRIIIYNSFKGKSSNTTSQELIRIVNQINDDRNVCSAYVDKSGDLVLRYVLSFDDRLSPKLFRLQLEHVKTSSENILKIFSERLSPYYK